MNQHYFSPTAGFSSDDTHGPRTLSVPDPAWAQPERPKIRVPDPDWKPSGADGEEQPLITVPDPDWTPLEAPLIEVPNPETRIPVDAKPISAELHVYLLDGQTRGQVIDVDTQGLPVLLDRQAVVVVPTAADVLAKRDVLLATATLRIAPLQDAVDLDDATAAERAALKAWKQYRVALSRVEQQAGFPAAVNWPFAPD